MAHGTARAAATACLGLIALQAVSTDGGSGRISQLLADANGILQRVLDPTVPAIPDRNSVAAGAARSEAAGNDGPARTMPVNPASGPYRPPGQAPGPTRTNYPTNGLPFPVPASPTWPSFNVPVPR